MNALRTAPVLLATAIALLVLPPAAQAQYVVPPDNSAVNQYTETVPTAGGGQDTDRQGKKHRSPDEVLGAGNAKRLEAHGPQGRAAAEVAAATAPDANPPHATPALDPQDVTQHKQGDTKGAREAETPSPAAEISPSSSNPSGSSGFGEVIAQATGSSSSGEMGLLLPLVILAALAWSLSYFWRQRRRVG